MSKNIKGQLERLNQQHKETDALYHGTAVKFGLSDCVFWILYVLCESEIEYTQNDLANEWFYPKQTINSAISNLVKNGYVRLEVINGMRNCKIVHLTDSGREFCTHNIQKVIKAEHRALSRLSEDERQTFLDLSEKHLTFLKEETKNL